MAVSKLNPSSGANDFNVQLSGSYVKVDLSKEYSAGAYSITSNLNDTSLDVYAFNVDGSSAGSTATKSLVATKGFSKLVVVGGADGDILSFSYKQTFTTSAATVEVGIPPIAVSVSPSALPNVDDSTTVSGYNFADGMTAAFVGTDDVSRNAKSVVVGSSTSAIITRPDILPVSASPYDLNLSVTGVEPPTGSLVGGLTNVITAGSGPSWTTASPLPAFSTNVSYTTTLVATDPDPAGSISSYAIVSGSLPTGLTLASTSGVISGTPTSSAEVTFTVRATNQDNDYADRTFLLPNASPVWTTAAGALAEAELNSAYSVTVTATDDGTVTYSVVSGALPTGISLNASTGVISGTPTVYTGLASPNSFTVRVTDNSGNTVDRAFTIAVLQPTYATITTTSDWTAPAGITTIDYIVVAGGGTGGGPGSNVGASGGGAGGMIVVNGASVTPGSSYSAVIGAGGSSWNGGVGDNGYGLQGGNSSFLGTTANGGGGGGAWFGDSRLSGGSGGGQSGNGSRGFGIAGQGNNGGDGRNQQTWCGGGGKGSAGGLQSVGAGYPWVDGVTYAGGGSGNDAGSSGNGPNANTSYPNKGWGGTGRSGTQTASMYGSAGVVKIKYLS